MARLQKLFDAIVDGKAQLAQSLVEDALKAGTAPMALISETMLPAMDEVGQLFQEEEFFVPELLLAGRAMKAAMEPLRPLLAAAGAKPIGVVVAGAVKGDLHDIGKNLVGMMAEGAGFTIVNLGTDTSADEFIRAATDHNAEVIGMSALLTTTMIYMKTVVDAVHREGLGVKIAVGGAPVTQKFCDEIGADGYAADAASAVELFKRLVAARKEARAQ